MLNVLSVNCFVTGHVRYQLSLEKGFSQPAHGIDFESVHLPDANRSDWLGRLLYQLLTWRPRRDEPTDWHWNRLRSELATSVFLRRLLRRRLIRRCPSVLHLHTQSIALLSADLLRRVPSVVSMDCSTALLMQLHPAPAARTYQPIIRLERACSAAATHIVCWSELVRRSVITDYSIDSTRVSVTRLGVARNRLPARRTPDDPRRKLRLLFVGNDFERKGGLDLLHVFQANLKSTFELDIVSHGLKTCPALPGVRLHRGLNAHSEALLQLYADADVFVMPTYEDAFGSVYVEAMSAGLPCIGSTVLAVPELVQNAVTGLTVQPGDRVALRTANETLRDDPGLRRRLAQAGRAFAERECDEATNCARLATLFRQVSHAAVSPGCRATEVRSA
jgi:glycosyltransferase involved in cell wall biosynthesis